LIRPYALKHGVRLEPQVDGGAEYVNCSGQDFAQALFQLVKNGIEAAAASPEPRWVRVDAHVDLARSELVVRVSDSGAGLDVEQLATLFVPFHGSATTTGRLGLGLSTVKDLVTKNAGQVEYVPFEAHTTFQMRFGLVSTEPTP